MAYVTVPTEVEVSPPNTAGLRDDQQVSQFLVFSALPPDDVVLAFREHVSSTGQPETFQGICTTKPMDGARFEILDDEFRINLLKRADGQKAPCPICSPNAPKYLLGVLVWYPGDGFIRAIGHECGSAADKHQRSEAEKRAELRLKHRRLLHKLGAELPKVRQHLAACYRVARAAEHAETMASNLRRRVKTYCARVVDEVNRNGGQLTVVDEFVSAAGRRESVARQIGAPSGIDFLRSLYKPNVHRLNAIRLLEDCDRGLPGEARAWLALNAEQYPELDRIDANLSKGLKELSLALGQIPKAAEFLAPSNLALIERWAREVPIPRLTCSRRVGRIYFRGPSMTGAGEEAWLDPDFGRLEINF